MHLSSKTEHYQALSLFFPCEIFSFKPVFGACSCSFQFNAITFIWADNEKLHISCSMEICKKLIPIKIQKCSLNVMEALHEMKFWKFSIFMSFSNTRFILKSVHFIWSQLEHRMKSSNYVLEFNSSKNFKFSTPQIWTFLWYNVQRFPIMQYHS